MENSHMRVQENHFSPLRDGKPRGKSIIRGTTQLMSLTTEFFIRFMESDLQHGKVRRQELLLAWILLCRQWKPWYAGDVSWSGKLSAHVCR